MYAVVIERTAEKEWAEGAMWYEQQQPGLGNRFVSEVKTFLATLGVNTERFGLVSTLTRKARIPSWPYSAYFSVDAAQKRVTVIAIWHGRRDPRTLGRRLARLEG